MEKAPGYTFVLAEAEVETVPEALWADSAIRTRARKRGCDPGAMILDQAYDHAAMRALPEGDSRGRPDIFHMLLLLVQDSPLTKRGMTRVLVHTRHDELIRVQPNLRVMRNQAMFVHLLEDLFRLGHAPRGKSLLTIEPDRDLASILAETSGTKVLLDENGPFGRTAAFAAMEPPVTITLGGFPKGRFRQAKPEMFDRIVSLQPEPLTVWTTLVPILAGFEDRLFAHDTPRER